MARKRLTAAVIVLAVAGAIAVKVSSHPKHSGSAVVQLLVDSPVSAIADLRQNTIPLATRASILAQLMTATTVDSKIAKLAGVPVDQLMATGPFSGPGQAPLASPSASPSTGPSASGAAPASYQLNFAVQNDDPLITVTAEAPTLAAAGRLANAVYPAMYDYLSKLQAAQRASQQSATSPTNPIAASIVPAGSRVTIRELGPAQVGVISSGSVVMLAAASFLGLLIVGLSSVLGLESARQKRQQRGQADEYTLYATPDPGAYSEDAPAPVGPHSNSRRAVRNLVPGANQAD